MLRIDLSASPVASLAFDPLSGALATGRKDGTVWILDPAGDGHELQGLANVGSAVSGLAFHPAGELLLGLRSAVVGLTGEQSVENLPVRAKAKESPISLAVVSDKLLAVGFGDPPHAAWGHVSLFEYPTGKLRPPTFTEPHGVRAVTAHPRSKTLAWSNGSRRVTVRDITRPDPIQFNLSHVSPAIAIHPDGNVVAAAIGYDVAILDVSRKQQRATIRGHGGTVAAVAFSPDGRTLATGSWDKSVRFWEVGSWAERSAFRWEIGRILALAFSPDGTRVAAGSDTGSVLVWDLE